MRVSKKTQIIQYDVQGKTIYASGMSNKCIKGNKNGNICVADFDTGTVLVTDGEGKFRFRYTGSTLSPNDVPFRPVGITTDGQDHTLIQWPYISLTKMVSSSVSCTGSSRLPTDTDGNMY